MKKAGTTDAVNEARVKCVRFRVPEEFHDLDNEPGCTNNLIHAPRHRIFVNRYQRRLRRLMVETPDQCVAAFDARTSTPMLPEALKNDLIPDTSRGLGILRPWTADDAARPFR